MKSFKEYLKILSGINCVQTFRLYLRVRKPRSSSIRVLNRSDIFIHPTAALDIGERTYFEINRQDYAGDKGKSCRITLLGGARMCVQGSVSFHRGSEVLVHENACFCVGNQTYLNGAIIDCSDEITIGEYCAIADGVKIMDNSFHPLTKDGVTKESRCPVRIGNKVWIATNAIILPDVTIGDGAVVAAGSVVTKSVPARCVVAGVPAKVIKENVDWKNKNETLHNYHKPQQCFWS